MTELIKFSKEQQNLLTDKLQDYFASELNYDLGSFDAQFLLDFIRDEIGLHFYNQGVIDAQAVLAQKTDEIQDAITQLEQFPPTKKTKTRK